MLSDFETGTNEPPIVDGVIIMERITDVVLTMPPTLDTQTYSLTMWGQNEDGILNATTVELIYKTRSKPHYCIRVI